VHDFAAKIPMDVVCRFLGIPFEDGLALMQDARNFGLGLEASGMNDTQIKTASASTERLSSYFSRALNERRERPGDDIVSLLISSGAYPDSLIIANIVLLFFVGYESTASAISNALIVLYRHPDELQRLRNNPFLLVPAIAECLRFGAPIQMNSRAVLNDVEIDRISLKTGDYVYLSLSSANRDPDKFEEPDRFMIDRVDADAHLLTFGGGIHYCLGARLVYIEIEAALGTLLRRLPSLQLTNLDDLKWSQINTLRAVESLSATW
jgi:cytochrome P450